MTDEVQAVTMNIKTGDSLKVYKVLNKNAKEDSPSVFTHDGKNYVKMKLSDGIYRYILDTDEEVSTGAEEKEEPTEPFFSWDNTKYDKFIDGLFDALDNVMGTDNKNLTSDGENDGNISAWEKAKRAFKGAIITPLKSIIRHPLVSFGAAIGIGAAVAAAPVIGTVLFAAGLVIGIGTLGYGAYKAYNAKTDTEARNAWENIGSGVMTTVLSTKVLSKLAPKDNYARTPIRKFFHNFKSAKATKDETIGTRISNLGHRLWGKEKIYNKTEALRALGEAKSAAQSGNLSTAKTLIHDIKRMGLKDKKVIEKLAEADKAYSAAELTVPRRAGTYTWAGILGNWSDNSLNDLQELQDNALSFAAN